MSGADDPTRLTDAARAYLAARHGDAAAYRLEIRDPGGGDRPAVVWAVHPDDERAPAPGGGRSLELHLDPVTGEVRSEYGFQ